MTDNRGKKMVKINQQGVKDRLQRLKDLFKEMKKMKIPCPETKTKTGELVAQLYNSKYPDDKMDASVFRRKGSYYRKALEKFRNDMGKSDDLPVDNPTDLITLELLVRQQKNEIEMLTKSLEKAYSKQSSLEMQVADHLLPSTRSTALDLNKMFNAFLKIMNAADGFIIDVHNRTIIDDISNQAIVTNDEMPEFFDWYCDKKEG
ncbi:hypothetical protein [Neptuniibacter sp.]|uniref:hypothetical protein n=1 Tax=Neptuniibacter sp. TaxID=1962643 RepID=UPI003B5989F0